MRFYILHGLFLSEPAMEGLSKHDNNNNNDNN